MAMNDKLTALDVMRDAPVIPVIVLNDVKDAVPLARALVAGGIRMLEVTLRTPQALQCIEAIARDVPEAVAGAGTIRSAADAQASALAGATTLAVMASAPKATADKSAIRLDIEILPFGLVAGGHPPAKDVNDGAARDFVRVRRRCPELREAFAGGFRK